MSTDMTAAVLQAPRRFAVMDRPMPVAGKSQVVVRFAATAVCHTDLSIYTGDHPGVRYPVVPGHECAGTVESVGEAVESFQPGNRVIVNPVISCGECGPCQRGLRHLCSRGGLFGRDVDGSLCNYAAVDASALHMLPPALPFAEATIIETLATVLHCQKLLRITAGEPAVVLGQGATGLLHTRLAVLAGASPVIGVSRSGWKLDLAKKMGAHHVVAAGAAQALSEVLRLTGQEGAEVVIDTAGSGDSLTASIDMLRAGGRLAPYAVSHHSVSGLSTFPLYFKELTILGSRALSHEDMNAAIGLTASGTVNLSPLISSTWTLGQTAEAFREYESHPERVLRIVIDSTVH